MFLQASVCPRGEGGLHGCSGGMGACVVAPGGACVVAPGGACMVAPGGACVVAPGGVGGHAWLLLGGACVVTPGGVCMVALGGMHGCSGGRAWLLWGGVHGCSRGGMHGFFDDIRSMSGRYASYWNQGGHIPAKIKFPVFSLSFPCARKIFPVLFLCHK